jgi:hypothetical protein
LPEPRLFPAAALARLLPAAALALLLAACSEEEPSEPAAPADPKPRPEAPALPAPEVPTTPTSTLEATGAAAVLRSYYDHIGSRRFSEAHALREPRRGDEVRAFAAHFGRFASHKATVGAPSEPVGSGEWVYVELPVQTYGTLADGTPFGSAGTITVRRAKQGGPWRIYTKG